MTLVGIVIVSHSQLLAEGVRELATQMTQDKVSIATAGGIDDPDHPLGTDALQVQQAIESVYSPAGVLVLMDLGSALMSAEMALEFLSEEQQQHIHLCEAPLVEGAIAAAVAAATGCTIDQVMAEARGALAAKASQLGISIEQAAATESPVQPIDDRPALQKEIRVRIHNRLGLHARPAAQFVATVAQFDAQISVQNLSSGSQTVRADSMNQLTLLSVRQGDELRITATGNDAEAALAALQALIAANFNEADLPINAQAPPQGIVLPEAGKLIGIPASPGLAIAPLTIYRPVRLQVGDRQVDDPAAEWQRFETTLQSVQQELQILEEQTRTQIGAAEAAIFAAHQQWLADRMLTQAVHQRVFEQSMNVEAAWQATIEEMVRHYRQLEDAYLQARATDIEDIGQRVLRHLIGTETPRLKFPQPTILVAADLTPSDTAQLDRTNVLGFCLAIGSATAHSAILARSLGIPAVVGLGPEILQLAEGMLLALDGQTGEVWITPDPDRLTPLQVKQQTWQATQHQARSAAHQPAVTRDGRAIPVLANISSVAEAQQARSWGAEGIGLLRTEFLFLDRSTAPSETEQLAVYNAIAAAMGDRPLTIRTLDVGGDKPLPYLSRPAEANPFLGYRGIRVSLDQPEYFKTQLRAILRASVGHPLKVMFPLIATVAEVRAAKAILADMQAELRQAGIPFDETMQVGIMLEVPAAVAIADQLAAEVDFFSIGSNDLSQYAMAADRTNSQVASLADALHPAVLRLMQQGIQAAHTAGIWVGLCGEIAADPIAIPVLLGLGVDEISLNSAAIPVIKQTIGQWSMAEAKAIADAVLQLETATQVRDFVAAQASRHALIESP